MSKPHDSPARASVAPQCVPRARGRRRFGRAAPLAAIAGALFATSAGAATYYVDVVAGSDSAAGTTAASAWKTLTKVNATTFAAGDQILFHSGQT